MLDQPANNNYEIITYKRKSASPYKRKSTSPCKQRSAIQRKQKAVLPCKKTPIAPQRSARKSKRIVTDLFRRMQYGYKPDLNALTDKIDLR